jgi:TRAP-type transport system periplasmic protein
MAGKWTRRSLLAGAAAMGSSIIVRPTLAADHRFSQYHNQAASGTLHKDLTAMWEAVRNETKWPRRNHGLRREQQAAGRRSRRAENADRGRDPVLHPDGRHHRHGGAGGRSAAIAVAFKNAAEAHKAIDGPLGRYIG